MSKMSVKEWKDFLIDVYFDAKNTGNILNRDVIDDSGSTPFVTASPQLYLVCNEHFKTVITNKYTSSLPQFLQ